MNDVWEQLESAGVPLGAVRPAGCAVNAGALRLALERITPEMTIAQRETLTAWLSAFHHHWPKQFAAVLGDAGEQLRVQLLAIPMDANRYLKLRRIAIENLSHLTIG